MDLCELRAVQEHERQPVAHINTRGLSSARASNAETPGLMCSRIMETWENNVNIAEVPGDQFVLVVFYRNETNRLLGANVDHRY